MDMRRVGEDSWRELREIGGVVVGRKKQEQREGGRGVDGLTERFERLGNVGRRKTTREVQHGF